MVIYKISTLSVAYNFFSIEIAKDHFKTEAKLNPLVENVYVLFVMVNNSPLELTINHCLS